MHEDLFSKAASPAPAVVLNLLLKPYSIGHDLRLIRTGNPLADSDSATPRQLSKAVLICHQSWRECERMPWDPLIRFKLWLWRRRCRKCIFEEELAKFITYRNAGSLELPPTGISQPGRGEVKIAGAPFLIRLWMFLRITMRMTEEQAWDCPEGFAKCQWGSYWEEYGSSGIYNEIEARTDAYIAEQERLGAAQL